MDNLEEYTINILRQRVENRVNMIDEHVYASKPEVLRGRGSYFITCTKKKYPTGGDRINRQTPEGGRWKLSSGRVVYDKQKSFVGKINRFNHRVNEEKTEWWMDEYSVDPDSKKEKWVLCYIYKKDEDIGHIKRKIQFEDKLLQIDLGERYWDLDDPGQNSNVDEDVPMCDTSEEEFNSSHPPVPLEDFNQNESDDYLQLQDMSQGRFDSKDLEDWL